VEIHCPIARQAHASKSTGKAATSPAAAIAQVELAIGPALEELAGEEPG